MLSNDREEQDQKWDVLAALIAEDKSLTFQAFLETPAGKAWKKLNPDGTGTTEELLRSIKGLPRHPGPVLPENAEEVGRDLIDDLESQLREHPPEEEEQDDE